MRKKPLFCSPQTLRNRRQLASSAAKTSLSSLKTAPRAPQDDPEDFPVASLFSSAILIRSGSNLASFSLPLGRPRRHQNRPRLPQHRNKKTSENHFAARWPPRWLQDGPGPPKGRPKTPQTPPRTSPKCIPRGSKIALRALKFAPRIPRRTVCISKETPRVPEQPQKTAALHTR